MSRTAQPQQPPPDQPGTLLETEEEVRRALAARNAGPPGTPTAPLPSAPTQPVRTPPGPSVPAYHPTLRAPVAVLTVFDDGKSDGEVIRLRGHRFVIGRTEGDLLLPHDGMISGRHVEITRQKTADGHRWLITDLQTTNGLFVRVSRIALAPGAEFLVGQGRYRFETSAPSQPADAAGPAAESGATQPWGADLAALPGAASLVEVTPGGPGARVALTQSEYWIGSDPSCAVRRVADPFVEARHVRLGRDGKGGWQAQNNKSVNGLWLRVPQVAVEDGCLFQIGEQRLRLKIGG